MRLYSVPSSTWADLARPRRVEPRRTRARSMVATSTAHSKVRCGFTPCARTSAELVVLPLVAPPWKARCYAFRAFHQGANLVFGGPLLGAPDLQVRIAVGRPRRRPGTGVRLRLDPYFQAKCLLPNSLPFCVALRLTAP